MECGFRPHDRDRKTESMEGLRWVIGLFGGVFVCNTLKAFAVTRLTVGASNDLQMERNLTGGLPVVYQGHLANLGPFRERLTPSHEKRQEGCAGACGSVGLQNGQRGKCSDA